jgi:hypothetical protein
MANVHKKRMETIRRRKEAEGLLGTPGIAKPSSFSGSLQHSQMPSSSSQAPSPSLHRPRKFAVSEKLARLFEDDPALVDAATPVTRPEPDAGKETPASGGLPDVEMLEASQPRAHHFSSDQVETAMLFEDDGVDEDGEIGDIQKVPHVMVPSPGSDSTGQFVDPDETDVEAEDRLENSLSPIEMAVPDRPYTKWRGGSSYQTTAV